ncbi:MAG: hypothetical protein ACE5I3_14900, partial [Phycisphaerae bacterium]
MSPVRLAIVGCCGRMGKTLLRLAAADPTLQLVADAARWLDETWDVEICEMHRQQKID